jgi:6-phosphofructokinase 1
MASRRTFVVEVMGRWCGFLALMGGMSAGAERVYLHEDRLTLGTLDDDVRDMVEGFRRGRRFHLAIRNEQASVGYTTDFLRQLFTEESGGLFDVRTMILGHLQQGGNPTPFDRVHAARLAAHSIDWLSGQILSGRSDWRYVAMVNGKTGSAPLRSFPDVVDMEFRRPKEQWWMALRPIMEDLARPPRG